MDVADSPTARALRSNPTWYAEQLAVLPAPFRVVECAEVRAAVREIAERMLAGSE